MALTWNWLCVPYIVCAVSLAGVGLAAGLIRGDRVLRIGAAGVAATAVPWAAASAVAACTSDPDLATRLLRLGSGPVALVGPSLLLVLLGVSGQLERHRWLARSAGIVGVALMAICWATDWVVSGVHALSSGILYIDPGPLTGVQFLQIGVWFAVGIAIARRSSSAGERRRMVRMLVGVLALGTVGSSDLLLVYQVIGGYPIAWACATIAAAVGVYFELQTDLLRPQGFDRDVGIELIGFVVAIAIVAVIVVALGGASPLGLALGGSLVWAAAIGVAWAVARTRPVRVAREGALEQFVGSLADVDSEPRIAERLTELWKQLAIEVRVLARVDGDRLVDVVTGASRTIEREIAAWIVEYNDLLAAPDLGTAQLGPIRPRLEQLVAGASTLVVPLIDRGTLVGMVQADHGGALREDERGLVLESARAAARALTYATLARAAARDRATEREVEVAEAMRLQASASRDDELGRWTVAGEYRTAPRTTGAGWSANLLGDGRLAVLVTEAQAHGVAAALATAALTGAFAAATTGGESARPRSSGQSRADLDELLASLRASSEQVVRGGEPVAAFLAILDADAQTITWACAGHPGAAVVGPVPNEVSFALGSLPRPTVSVLGGGGAPIGASLTTATRGEAPFGPDALLVVASTAVRGSDPERWQQAIGDQALAGIRVVSLLVDAALRAGPPHADLLAVVVRQRSVRRSELIIALE